MKSIILKEAKIRMRTWKTVGMITAYIILLGLTVVLMLYNQVYNRNGLINFSNNFTEVFIAITIVQVLMISFIVPIITAGSISLEREKQTLDILLSTHLRPMSIIMGKLMTSISQVLLLIVASLPIFSFVFLFGGINLISILYLVLFYVVISIFFGALGVFFSVIFKKTLTSIVMTYLVMIVLTVGTLIGTALYIDMTRAHHYYEHVTFWPLYFNPGLTFWAILMKQFGDIQRFTFMIGRNENFWLISTGIFVVLSIILIGLSAYFLNPIRKKWRKR
ncbi:hypothetical protein HZI73_12825 [Vallitalea pronyensis]|uniref:ABC-2 type transporter domain-containing protein n=1 Tax=Vallitalea pronyensis TaxID=1348613 RepID=A0A8J8MKG0_9FIRM|nr:ABC transporter permease [Vallitalea pronyensis]QUI23116.1 hypothetical protein HZI73_12825 [Vallitalea pronyensis]